MILYVVRHAEAEDKSVNRPDEWRYLTEKGRKAAVINAKALSERGAKSRRIITSPLTRAVQTAEIFARFACRRNTVEASMFLLPENKTAEMLEYLNNCDDKRIMLVGHEPQLGLLVTALLDRKEEIELKKGACVAMKLEKDKPAQFLWYLVPGKKPVSSIKKAFKLK